MNKDFILPINLQLFAETDEDESEDVDYDESLDDSEGDSDMDLSDDDDDSDEDADTDETPEQDEDDSKGKPSAEFKKIRLREEERAQKKLEAEREALQKEKEVLKAQRLQLVDTMIEKNVMDTITHEKVWEKADAEGISEDAARKILVAESRQFIESEKHRIRGQIQETEAKKKELRKEEFYSQLEPELNQLLDANPNADPAVIYKYLVGNHYQDLVNSKKKQSDKGAIADQQDKMRRRTVGATPSVRKGTATISDFTRQASIATGIDPRDVAKHVAKRRGNFRI